MFKSKTYLLMSIVSLGVLVFLIFSSSGSQTSDVKPYGYEDQLAFNKLLNETKSIVDGEFEARANSKNEEQQLKSEDLKVPSFTIQNPSNFDETLKMINSKIKEINSNITSTLSSLEARKGSWVLPDPESFLPQLDKIPTIQISGNMTPVMPDLPALLDLPVVTLAPLDIPDIDTSYINVPSYTLAPAE